MKRLAQAYGTKLARIHMVLAVGDMIEMPVQARQWHE